MVFSRWDAYKNTLESSTNFKRFFEWFDLMEDEERREKIERDNTKYRSPILETVRRALSLFVGDRFTNPRIEIKPLRFVMDEISVKYSPLILLSSAPSLDNACTLFNIQLQLGILRK